MLNQYWTLTLLINNFVLLEAFKNDIWKTVEQICVCIFYFWWLFCLFHDNSRWRGRPEPDLNPAVDVLMRVNYSIPSWEIRLFPRITCCFSWTLLRLTHVTVYSTALRKTTPHPFSLYHCINRQGNTWLSQQCWVHSLSYFHLCVSFSYSVPAPEKKGSMQHSKIVLSAWDRAAFGFIKNLFREGKLHRLFIWFGFLNEIFKEPLPSFPTDTVLTFRKSFTGLLWLVFNSIRPKRPDFHTVQELNVLRVDVLLPIIFDLSMSVCFSGNMTFKQPFSLVLVECLYARGRDCVFALCGFPPAVEGSPRPPSPSSQPAEREGATQSHFYLIYG